MTVVGLAYALSAILYAAGVLLIGVGFVSTDRMTVFAGLVTFLGGLFMARTAYQMRSA